MRAHTRVHTHTHAHAAEGGRVCHRPDLACVAPRRYIKGEEWWSRRLPWHVAHLPASIFPDKTLLATHILPLWWQRGLTSALLLTKALATLGMLLSAPSHHLPTQSWFYSLWDGPTYPLPGSGDDARREWTRARAPLDTDPSVSGSFLWTITGISSSVQCPSLVPWS